MKKGLFITCFVTCCIILIISNAYSQEQVGSNQGLVRNTAVEDETDIPITNVDSDGQIKETINPEDLHPNFYAGPDDFLPLEASKYTLGKNDVIDITVYRHSEVSGQFRVNNEGKIQYNFVGDVLVEGLTKDEVKTLLIKRLDEFIISPDVTVKTVGYNSKIVYVIGEVGLPGKIYMRGDTITVREALIQARLPLLTAKASKAALITPSADGNPDRKKVNIHKLLYEGDLRENLIMKPGDTLYLPPTIMAKAMRIINPIAQPIGAAAGTGRTVMTGF